MKIAAWINLFGVLALAALCGVQWGVNRRANLLAVNLDKIRQEQAAKISEQSRTIAGCMADLDDFRQRVERLTGALTRSQDQVAALRTEAVQAAQERDKAIVERDQLLAERERSRALIAKWAAAVGERDVALKKANDEIAALTKQRNEAVMRFNDLAGRYNAIVKDLNESRVKPSSNP